jgi:hypothetical protein
MKTPPHSHAAERPARLGRPRAGRKAKEAIKAAKAVRGPEMKISKFPRWALSVPKLRIGARRRAGCGRRAQSIARTMIKMVFIAAPQKLFECFVVHQLKQQWRRYPSNQI